MIQKNAKGLYEALKSDILMGHFAPGTKLKMDMLKKRYGMGVNVVRESLARLATEDLVDSIDQKGFRVVQTSLARLSDLTRLRILLETDGVKHSIANGGIDWESNLVAAHQKLLYIENKMCQDEDKHSELWSQYDWEFHSSLIAACGSQLHCLYYQRIFDQFRQFVMVDLKTKGFRGSDIITEHGKIVEAALKRDVEQCLHYLEKHLNFYYLQQLALQKKKLKD